MIFIKNSFFIEKAGKSSYNTPFKGKLSFSERKNEQRQISNALALSLGYDSLIKDRRYNISINITVNPENPLVTIDVKYKQ